MEVSPVDPMRNHEEFARSLRNFHGWLDGAAPGATDLDFFVERKGNFFVCELKPWVNGVLMPYGQHLALYRLSQVPQFNVLLAAEDGEDVWVTSYHTDVAPLFTKKRGRSEMYWTADRFDRVGKDGLRKLVEEWWEAASV